MKRLKENRWFLLAAVLLCCLLCFLLLSGRGAGGSGTSEEKRIAQVLSAISGAGKVEVAVSTTVVRTVFLPLRRLWEPLWWQRAQTIWKCGSA